VFAQAEDDHAKGMELVPMAGFTIVTRSSSSAWIPELIAAAGAQVTETYIDFFTSTIRNRNTRAAYARACWQFFDWCAAHSLELTTVRPFHVAAWIEDFPGSKPTIKQKLAAVRMLYDFLVVRQITPSNPAHSVRGPKYVVKKGKTGTSIGTRPGYTTSHSSKPRSLLPASRRRFSRPILRFAKAALHRPGDFTVDTMHICNI
jgi:hypothetical protein